MLADLILITCQSTTAIEIVRFGLIATPHHRSLWVDFGQSRQAEIGQKLSFTCPQKDTQRILMNDNIEKEFE